MKQLKTFAERLEDARIEARRWLGHIMSQVELAERLGLASQTVSQWESGAMPKTYEMMESAAKELRVRAGWLAFGEEPREIEPARSRGKVTAGAHDT